MLDPRVMFIMRNSARSGRRGQPAMCRKRKGVSALIRNLKRQRGDDRRLTPAQLHDSLSQWLDSPLGQSLLAAEREQLQPIISRVFGFHVLQVGCAAHHSMLKDCPVSHKIAFAPRQLGDSPVPVADNEALPLGTESIDAVVVHHALDFTPDSHQLLREAARVVVPGGKLLIIGFNPLSLWGLSRALRWRPRIPWNARFISRLRVTDWLKLLDFQLEEVRYGGYMPPVARPRVVRQAQRFERLGNRVRNPLGCFYVIVATKQVLPVNPIVERWPQLRTPVLGGRLAQTGRVIAGRYVPDHGTAFLNTRD